MRSWAIFSAVTILVCGGLWIGTSSSESYCIGADIGEKTPELYHTEIVLFRLKRSINLLGTTDRLYRFDEGCGTETGLFLYGYALEHCLDPTYNHGSFIKCPRPVNLSAIEFEVPAP